MPFDAERLYALLPAIVRIRDAEQGEPLKALAALIASEVAVLEENLEQLYDDQFIETCADWVVPYIGDLIGWEPLQPVAPKVASPRAEVANTIAYRRRKGTAAVLEQFARDVTGWPARVVEYFELLATTQYMNHPRPHNRVTPDLRRGLDLLRIGGAFDPFPRTVEVRRIGKGGRWNIPNIGVHLWRIGAYQATRWPAARVDARRYRVSPLGQDIPLYTRPETEDTISHLAEPMNVPEPLRRRVVAEDLAGYYGPGKSLCLWVGNEPIPIEQIRVCDLADRESRSWANAPPAGQYAIDPERGRVYLPSMKAERVRAVTLDFHYGSAADLGGGEYVREATFTAGLEVLARLHAGDSLADALTRLRKSRTGGILEIAHNAVSAGPSDGFGLEPAAGTPVELRSADGYRAILAGGGGVRIGGGRGAVVRLNGLLIKDGPVLVPSRGADGPQKLILRHCTLVPGRALKPDGEPREPKQPSLVIEQPGIEVEIEDSILGGIRAVKGARVTLRNCILDATDPKGIAFAGAAPRRGDAISPPGDLEPGSARDGLAAGAALTLENCTVIGAVRTERMRLASNTLFVFTVEEPAENGPPPLLIEQKQSGCVRFCYLPGDSSPGPNAYRCQPATAIEAGLAQACREDPATSAARREAIAAAVRARVQPVFVTRRFGEPGYGLLRHDTDPALLTGADNGSEIGAFNRLFHVQRLANLHTRFREYLRLGLEAGVFFEDE
jgi:hypothetical protein